jgi:hypothetical protein
MSINLVTWRKGTNSRKEAMIKPYISTENTVSRIGIEYISSVSNNYPRQRGIGLVCPSSLVCITFKEEMTQILCSIL